MANLGRDIKIEFYEKLIEEGKLYHLPIITQAKAIVDKHNWKYYNKESMSFSMNMLRSDDLMEEIQKHSTVIDIPVKYYNENELWMLIEKNVYSVLAMQWSDITERMFIYAVNKDPLLLAFLDEYHQTIQIVESSIKKEPLLLEYVRDDLRAYWLCREAVKRNWMAIEFVPTELIDKELMDLVLENDDCDIIDYIPTTLLDVDLYTRFLQVNPKRFVDFLLKMLLNPENVADLIEIITSGGSITPEFLFTEGDPKIFEEDGREGALILMFDQHPKWMHLLPVGCVSDLIFQFALQKNELLDLSPIAWSKEKINIAYEVNKRGFTRLPLERMNEIDEEYIATIVGAAIEEKWLHELPSYFFTTELIESKIYHTALMEMREEYLLTSTRKDNFDFEKLGELDFSLGELLRVNTRTDHIEQSLLDKNIEGFVLLTEESKTLELSKAFIKKYPMRYDLLPSSIIDNTEALNILLSEIPQLNRYIPSKKLEKLFMS